MPFERLGEYHPLRTGGRGLHLFDQSRQGFGSFALPCICRVAVFPQRGVPVTIASTLPILWISSRVVGDRFHGDQGSLPRHILTIF